MGNRGIGVIFLFLLTQIQRFKFLFKMYKARYFPLTVNFLSVIGSLPSSLQVRETAAYGRATNTAHWMGDTRMSSQQQ